MRAKHNRQVVTAVKPCSPDGWPVPVQMQMSHTTATQAKLPATLAGLQETTARCVQLHCSMHVSRHVASTVAEHMCISDTSPFHAVPVVQDFGSDSAEHRSSLCTYNLHLLACLMLSQVLEQGHTSDWLEVWLERFLGFIKRRTKYRIKHEPEKLLVQDHLLGASLSAAAVDMARLCGEAAANPKLLPMCWDILNYRAWCGRYVGSSTLAAAMAYDPGSSLAVGVLVGQPRSVQLDANVLRNIKRCLQNNGVWQDGWAEGWQECSVQQYTKAILPTPSEQEVTSVAYKGSISRDGKYVLVVFQTRGEVQQPQAGVVQHFLKIQPPGDAPAVRLAMVDLYHCKFPVTEAPDIADLVVEHTVSRGVQSEQYPVLLDHIRSPMMTTLTGDGKTRLFAPFGFRSNKVAQR